MQQAQRRGRFLLLRRGCDVRLYPTLQGYHCPMCGVPGTLEHLTLECPWHLDKDALPSPRVCCNARESEYLIETWEAKLVSEDLEQQRRLVARAKEAAKARGFLE
ncbi:uncharacterized protein LOC142573880 [Dermacentor variabilis]|uniref:uncharacterized protein LOC142573880 n=1 Tax=Dermacentor variabilis TaxID=34621 RepID=UPI003F5C0479